MAVGYYRVNFRSQSYRPSRGPNTIGFGAADDGTAENVADELGNWTVGQETSLQKEVFFDNGLPYPVGTRVTANMLVGDAGEQVARIRLRNVLTTATEDALTALVTGAASVTAPFVFPALSAPPQVVSMDTPITTLLTPGKTIKS